MKKSQNSRNKSYFYNFCLMIEGSGSGSLTNGSKSGSGRPKNLWILRIPDLVPQHRLIQDWYPHTVGNGYQLRTILSKPLIGSWWDCLPNTDSDP
jgi:hypothetical protein